MLTVSSASFWSLVQCIQEAFVSNVSSGDTSAVHDAICAFVTLILFLLLRHLFRLHEMWVDRHSEDYAYYVTHLPQDILQAMELEKTPGKIALDHLMLDDEDCEPFVTDDPEAIKAEVLIFP